MKTEILDKEIRKALKRIFTRRAILFNNVKTLLRTRNLWAFWILALNYWHYRNIFMKGRGDT